VELVCVCVVRTVPGDTTVGGCDQKPLAMPKTADSTFWPIATWPGYQFGIGYTTDASVASPAAVDDVAAPLAAMA